MVTQRPTGIAADRWWATVVLPEPVPPAIPTTSGRSDVFTSGGLVSRDGGCEEPHHEGRHRAADVEGRVLTEDLDISDDAARRVLEQLVQLRVHGRDELVGGGRVVRVDGDVEPRLLLEVEPRG